DVASRSLPVGEGLRYVRALPNATQATTAPHGGISLRERDENHADAQTGRTLLPRCPPRSARRARGEERSERAAAAARALVGDRAPGEEGPLGARASGGAEHLRVAGEPEAHGD